MNYSFDQIISSINSFLSIQILNNEIHKIILAVIIFFIVYFGLKFVMRYVHRMIKKYIKNKEENIGIVLLNIIKNLPKWFFLVLELYIPLKVLNLPYDIDIIINAIFLFVLTIQIIEVVIKILTFSLS